MSHRDLLVVLGPFITVHGEDPRHDMPPWLVLLRFQLRCAETEWFFAKHARFKCAAGRISPQFWLHLFIH